MAQMISASDVLQILSELHQFSMILIELGEPVTLGIVHSSEGELYCFVYEATLGASERAKLATELASRHNREQLRHLPVEEFLRTIDGKRSKHIWLETGGSSNHKELAFVSISELKSHLRTFSKR